MDQAARVETAAARRWRTRPRAAKAKRAKSRASSALAGSSDRRTEALLRSTLDALSAHIAVLDESGTIVAVNEAWRSFARASGFPESHHGIGMNYLAVCERGAKVSEDAARTAKALRDIIAGKRAEFRMEYPCAGPDGPRWFQLRVTRPPHARPRRVVIAHEDITEVKAAQEALARLSTRLIQIQDEERRSIARELHDTTAQNLLAITLNATRLSEPLRGAGESASRILRETVGLAEQSLQEVRTLSYLLHPPLLDDIGLASALRWLARGFAERSGIAIRADIDEDCRGLPRDTATTLFRVAQEAFSNIHRHSGSPSARIGLQRNRAGVRLEIADRGKGFKRGALDDRDVEVRDVGVGISGMRVRLQQLGGRLDIRSGRSGTRVIATVPVRPEKRRRDVRR